MAKAKAKTKPKAKAKAKAKPQAKAKAKAKPTKAAAAPVEEDTKPKLPAAEQKRVDTVVAELRAFGLAYPGTHLKSPWPGHKDLAVDDKTFAYMSPEGEAFGISCKLPHSCALALALPFCTPTPYGLGKSGWVSAQFPDSNLPVDMLKAWIDESYRAQAKKKRIAQIG